MKRSLVLLEDHSIMNLFPRTSVYAILVVTELFDNTIMKKLNVVCTVFLAPFIKSVPLVFHWHLGEASHDRISFWPSRL